MLTVYKIIRMQRINGLPTAFNLINMHAQSYKRTLNACGFIVWMKNRVDPDRVLNCFQARSLGDGRKTTNYSFPGITHISAYTNIAIYSLNH